VLLPGVLQNSLQLLIKLLQLLLLLVVCQYCWEKQQLLHRLA
jgi:hypothetical protein